LAHTVVLHIGAMKSGTSFVQQVLGANRDVLADQGFLFPGRAWRHQVHAVLDVLGQTRDGTVLPASVGAWQRLTDEIARFDGTAVVSMEFLGPAPEAGIERVLAGLAPAEVRVVLTARDLGRSIPAMWQEGLKNRRSWHWHDYLADLREGSGTETATRFWRQMNYPGIARRWSSLAGAERFTLVTVPPPGAPPRLLWERFCSVAGLNPEPFDLTGRDNASLGAASAQLLRALNAALPDDLPLQQYQKVVKHRLARHGLTARTAQEPPIGFAPDWVVGHAEAQIDRLRALAPRVVGDLEELRPVGKAGVDPHEVPAEERLAAAVDALAYLVRVWPTP
jgi:hypothetical protein